MFQINAHLGLFKVFELFIFTNYSNKYSKGNLFIENHYLCSCLKSSTTNLFVDKAQVAENLRHELTLNAPRKKMHLKMSSAEVVCCKWLPNITDELSIEANSMDPEKTAPIGAVWSGSTLFAQHGPREDCSYRSSLIWVHTVCHRGFLNIFAEEKSRRFLLRLRVKNVKTILWLRKMALFQLQHRFWNHFMCQGTLFKVCRSRLSKSIFRCLKFCIGLEKIIILLNIRSNSFMERSGSVVECLTRDRRAAGSSLTGVTALWSLSKTHLS